MKKANYQKSLLLMLAFLLSATVSAHDFEVDGIYYKIPYAAYGGVDAYVTYRGTSYNEYSNEYSGSVVIPATVTYNGKTYSVRDIDEFAFGNCNELTRIDIPNSIVYIGIGAFYDSGLENVDIPNSVSYIGQQAFNGCAKLISINLPSSLTRIQGELLTYCYSLMSINVASENPKYDSRDNCNAIIETSSNTLISGCKNTTIPNSVTSIGRYAFLGSIYLTNIAIPKSVTSIDYSAFAGCHALLDIYCFATVPPACDGEQTFNNYTATLHVPAASLAAYFTAPIWCNFENIVGDAVEPMSINISKDSVELLLGEQITLTSTITPVNASIKEVSWMSSDTSVAVVDNGNVTAVGYGQCDIIASCFGMQATCHILVANRITLDQQETILLPNHIVVLTPTASAVIPEGFTAISSDPNVAAARVVSGGKVQVVGIKEGTTTITVGSADGNAIPAICLITVYTEPGDLNSDGFVNISDVTSMIDYLLGNDDSSLTIKNADVNDDGTINIADVTSLIDTLLSKTE